ncbi:unnamed protein product [Prunus armeniaca]|uniref:Uncharacterized protein n=1 Tax=Prunus armeniaca TaxID=36596 RepID=A0A6J5VWZ1_PRUAR|nr:unnamed protein product [Prunus armeniaca]
MHRSGVLTGGEWTLVRIQLAFILEQCARQFPATGPAFETSQNEMDMVKINPTVESFLFIVA